MPPLAWSDSQVHRKHHPRPLPSLLTGTGYTGHGVIDRTAAFAVVTVGSAPEHIAVSEHGGMVGLAGEDEVGRAVVAPKHIHDQRVLIELLSATIGAQTMMSTQ